MTAIENPAKLAYAVGKLLDICHRDLEIKDLDIAELATVLATAGNVCSQMAAHNTSMAILANMIKNGPD